MKNQGLFSMKDKSIKLECRLLQFLFGALKVNRAHNISYKMGESIYPRINIIMPLYAVSL